MYYVDGNNVMANQLEMDLGTRSAEAYLITVIGRWADHTNNRVVLAFDGHPKNSPRSDNTRVKIMRPGDVSGARTADDVILKMIKQSHGAQTTVLVTNDVELQRAAHGLGVRTIIGSQEFLQTVKAVGTEVDEANLRRGDQKLWEREFGIANKPVADKTLPVDQPKARQPDTDEWARYLKTTGVKPLK